AWLARRVLQPAAVPWAVLLFACSDHLLWHTCEAKPYAVDIFLAAAVISGWWAMRSWPMNRQLLLWAAAAPGVIFLSFPGCFLYGGLLVAFVPAVWKERRAWLSYLLLVAVVFGSFGLLLEGPIHAQRCPEMTQCWSQFADW